MYLEKCKICYDRKADYKLPSCTHAICYRCWCRISGDAIHPQCPWCRAIQHQSKFQGFVASFARLDPVVQALVVFGIYKLVCG